MSKNKITIPHLYTPREYQIPLMGAVPKHYKRGVFVHHRRAGKDKSAFNKMVSEAIQNVGVYYYFFPSYKQGRKILWDGIDGRTGLKYLDHIPPQLLTKKNETEMKITLSNGSIIQIVGTDDFNSIMGTNPRGCIFSEFSLQDPRAWDYIRPILRENGGWAIFLYTPRGRNHGWTLYEMARRQDDWYAEVLTVEDTKREDGTPVISLEDIEADRREGMSEELIQQEYFCSFDGFVQGSYFSKQLQQAKKDGRITVVSPFTGYEVYTFWDLGMDDSTTIWFMQAIGNKLYFIDYYENSGEGLAHYAKVLKDKPYVYGDHYLPHDVEVRELGTGKSRREVLEDLGIHSIITVQRARDIQAVLTGIEAGRNIISQCWFDEDKCSRGLLALENYHAEYDEEKKKLHNRPAHDWSSHGADAFRTFAVGYSPQVSNKTATDNYMQYMTGTGGWHGG